MSKNKSSTMPISSALTVTRRQDASIATMNAANTAIDRMVMAGLQSGSSFKATVSVSGANVSATFHTADSQRQQSGQRPQTARPTPAPAVHQVSYQPVMQPRPVTAAPHPAAAAPPCKFFTAGFCKFGAACKFSHSVAQPPKAPQSARERVVPPVIASLGVAFAPAASSPARLIR